ncbi:MAG TPA: TIGR03000 domain-containing protein [Gemmataceae bacterium]|nr:TIGR03000 domain-containing protein [Gemmataceae bacterium]
MPSQLPTVPIRPVVPPTAFPPGTPPQLIIFPNQQAYLASAFFFAGPVNPRFNDTYGLPHPLAEVMPMPAWQSLGMGAPYYPWLWGYPDTTATAPAVTHPYPAEAVPPPPPNFIDRAVVTLEVPRASAEVWIGKEKLEDTGSVRYFFSPVLQPDKQYVYDVRVRWYEEGKERTRSLRLNVKAGEQPVVMVLGPLAK